MVLWRRVLRWMHFVGGLYIGAVLFSPLIDDPTALGIARGLAVALALSGLAMWQWGRVLAFLRPDQKSG